MTRISLILKFLGLSAFWGLVLGAGLGLVGGILFGITSLSIGNVLYLIILFAPISAIYGTFIGGIGGLVLGILTAIFHYYPHQLLHYKRTALLVLGMLTFLSVVAWFALQIDYTLSTAMIGLGEVFIIAAIAAVAAGYASQRIAKWYLWWHEMNYIRPISANK